MVRLCFTLAVFFAAASAQAEEPKPLDYNQDVLPVFRKYCLGCHDRETAEGKYVMDDFAALVRGGKRGAAIVPGDSKRSRLIRVLTGEAEPKMPPEDNEAPKPEEIRLLAAWIDARAKGPSGPPDPSLLIVPRIKVEKPAQSAVQGVAISPDGKLAAIATYREVQLVDAASGTIVRTWSDIPGGVTAVEFSHDGKSLATAAGEPGLFGQADLWNVADGKSLRQVRPHTDSLYAAAFSPDGKLLATAGYDKLIQLWELPAGKLRHTLKGHNDAVFDLAFSPDGRKLASASGDRTAKLWDTQSGQRLETFGQSLKQLYTVAFAPDGKHLVAGGVDSRIRIWQISDSGKEGTNPILHSRFAHEGAILNIVFSRDGKLLASTAEDQTVKVWETAGYSERLLLEKQPDWAAAIAFTPDAKSLLVGRHDGTLAFYDPATGSKQRDLTPKPPAPELTAVWPLGVEAGQTAQFKLTGKHLAGARVTFNHQDLKSEIKASADHEITLAVSAAAGLARGSYDLWLETPGGKTNAQKLYVDDLPQHTEAEPNDLPGNATLLQLPASAWGRLSQQGDQDIYAFDAAAGQTLVFDLAGAQLGSKANAMLTLTDDKGRVLASNNDFGTGPDPLLAAAIPADGRYFITVRDLLLAGSAGHHYRLSVGAFPFVTSVWPLSLGSKQQRDVELVGFNLPAGAKVSVTAGEHGPLTVPLDAAKYRFRKLPQLVVGHLPEQLEQEPNDQPQSATAIEVPGTVGGRMLPAGGTACHDADLFRFHAQAGEAWIIETDADRRGSPIDTRIEVLDASGQPVERMLLQAVRDSYVTFRPINSTGADVRVKNWEEMGLNQYLYMQGEVCKLYRMPQGPDSGFQFYTQNNVRRCYFDTSATTHALDEPCYIVEPHKPGTKLVPNGLPVFTHYFSNDDSGDRKLGKDSRLTFTAPVDGDYLMRVTDTRDRSGPAFGYRLTVRRPTPDFSVRISGSSQTINVGSGRQVQLLADRTDGFDGDIHIEITGLPPGFSASSPTVIQAGHLDAEAVISAAADAPRPTKDNQSTSKVTAWAIINGQKVSKDIGTLGTLKLAEKPQLIVSLEPAQVTIVPGRTVSLTLKVERNGFDDRIQFDVPNLPHGVIVDNIGLNGVLIPEGKSERTLFLNAAGWVPETSRPFFAVAKAVGSQSSLPVILHVRKEGGLAEAGKSPEPPASSQK